MGRFPQVQGELTRHVCALWWRSALSLHFIALTLQCNVENVLVMLFSPSSSHSLVTMMSGIRGFIAISWFGVHLPLLHCPFWNQSLCDVTKCMNTFLIPLSNELQCPSPLLATCYCWLRPVRPPCFLSPSKHVQGSKASEELYDFSIVDHVRLLTGW